MESWEQFSLFLGVAIPIVSIGYAFSLRLMQRLSKVPSFAVIESEEVHQYPLWGGVLSRTLNLKIKNTTNWFLGWWPSEVKASLRLIGRGKVDEKGWLSWKDSSDAPDHIRIPPNHCAWVRVLSVTEDGKTFIPLGKSDGGIHPTPIASGGYDVELILHCSLWRNQKVLYKRHWELPEDIFRFKFKEWSPT
jgi:hypothetical protein